MRSDIGLLPWQLWARLRPLGGGVRLRPLGGGVWLSDASLEDDGILDLTPEGVGLLRDSVSFLWWISFCSTSRCSRLYFPPLVIATLWMASIARSIDCSTSSCSGAGIFCR